MESGTNGPLSNPPTDNKSYLSTSHRCYQQKNWDSQPPDLIQFRNPIHHEQEGVPGNTSHTQSQEYRQEINEKLCALSGGASVSLEQAMPSTITEEEDDPYYAETSNFPKP